jgi:hypothetical protein
MSTQEIKPVIARAPEDAGSVPFQSALFGRKDLADRLTGYVERSGDGCVIGITAPWGEGKTYFGKNWKLELQQKEHKTFFLDAFQDDFSDDAFTTISAELLRGLSVDETKSRALWTATKKLGAALLPTAAKLTLSAAANFATGLTTDEIAEVIERAGESGAEAAERYVEKRLKDHEARLSTIKHFKTELTKYCKDQPKPVVFFIDELDRCRPPYAIQVIEHIKHFFDVPNLVFVLLLNREQLERSIQQAYGGEKEDAARYLGKFVHFFLTLPNAQSRGNNGKHDLQRAFVYLRLAKNFDGYSRGFAYLIALKLRYPEVFALLQIDPVGGSKRAITILEKVGQNAQKSDWEFFLLLHKIDAGLLEVNALSIPQQNNVDGWMAGVKRTKFFQIIAEIDLPEIE